jgi:predicted SnoaL-like aldol condensation-catalyzing enzyme
MSLKQSAINFLDKVVEGKIEEAFEKYVDASFVHHNAFFKGDRASLITAMKEEDQMNPQKEIRTIHALQDGNMVCVFSHVKQNPSDRGWAVSHLFRFNNEKIAEMWDVGMEVPEEEINENGVF